MSEVFISYKREEREAAAALAEYLSSFGYKVFWDADLLSGMEFRKVLLNQIKISKATIVLWSPRSVDSEFVQDEASRAQRMGKLLPVMIENCELPLGFGALHTHDLTGWTGDAADSRLAPLLNAVASKVERAPASQTPDTAGSKPVSASPTQEDQDAAIAEARSWAEALDRGTVSAIRAYLEKYGDDARFADQAKFELRRARLRRSTAGAAAILMALGLLITAAGGGDTASEVGAFFWSGEWRGQFIFPLGLAPLLILCAGAYLALRTRFRAQRTMFCGLRRLFSFDRGQGEGQISPAAAGWIQLGATVGVGNFAGVGTALVLGGAGALVWMAAGTLLALSALHGEAFLGLRYREKNERLGTFGGVMHYIANGLGNWALPLAALAAAGLLITVFIIGGSVQASSLGNLFSSVLPSFPQLVYVLLIVLPLAIVVGTGLRGVSLVSLILGPVLLALALLVSTAFIFANADALPSVLETVIRDAISPASAGGGVAGSIITVAIQSGLSRGVFSSGLGEASAGITHANAQSDQPDQQGAVAAAVGMLDGLVINLLVGLGLLCALGAENPHANWDDNWNGLATLYAAAQESFLWLEWPIVLLTGLALFTTMVSFALIGERVFVFLFGVLGAPIFRVLYISTIAVSAFQYTGTWQVSEFWMLANLGFALVLIPVSIALIALAGVVARGGKTSG